MLNLAREQSNNFLKSRNFNAMKMTLRNVLRCVRIIEVLFVLQQASNFGLDEHVLHNLLSLENLQNVDCLSACVSTA